MSEKAYKIKDKYIMFEENNEVSCLCTFPHNYAEKLEMTDLQSLALLGAVVRLVIGGYYDDHKGEYIFIPSDVPEWIIREVDRYLIPLLDNQ